MTQINDKFISDARDYYGRAYAAIEKAREGDDAAVIEALDHSHTALLDLIEWADQITRYLKSTGAPVETLVID